MAAASRGETSGNCADAGEEAGAADAGLAAIFLAIPGFCAGNDPATDASACDATVGPGAGPSLSAVGESIGSDLAISNRCCSETESAIKGGEADGDTTTGDGAAVGFICATGRPSFGTSKTFQMTIRTAAVLIAEIKAARASRQTFRDAWT